MKFDIFQSNTLKYNVAFGVYGDCACNRKDITLQVTNDILHSHEILTFMMDTCNWFYCQSEIIIKYQLKLAIEIPVYHHDSKSALDTTSPKFFLLHNYHTLYGAAMVLLFKVTPVCANALQVIDVLFS